MQACSTIPLDYPRYARRIRAIYARQPARKLEHLCRLARFQDESERPAGIQARSKAISSEEFLLQSIRQQFAGSVLTYSARQSILRQADLLGIGRFQANLLIALAQHHASSVSHAGQTNAKLHLTWLWAGSLALVTQALVLAGGWWLISL